MTLLEIQAVAAILLVCQMLIAMLAASSSKRMVMHWSDICLSALVHDGLSEPAPKKMFVLSQENGL